MDKQQKEHIAEHLIQDIRNHSQLFYNDGWDELSDGYTDDDIFNTLVLNNISSLEQAIQFFDNRFNPYRN